MKLTPYLASFGFSAFLLAIPNAFAEPADPGGVEFFEKKIRPILTAHCYECHSKEATKVKGGLLLDSQAALLKGGDTGSAIVPGDPEKSLLITAVRYTDENLQMPPKNKKLSEAQIVDLEAWVKMGAPDPRTSDAPKLSDSDGIDRQARSHWAFQPLTQPAVPSISNTRWVQTPVDAFILAKLESMNLPPSPRADKRTLVRRATYDLIGLPPEPEEVEAFLQDKSLNAFAKVVDRLLAAPQYGERWGRHWLDVARYADTKGYVFEEERRYPYAYTYRDYVIRSFNQDLPYNQFIVQQIAADLLPLGEDKRALAALGFLTLGRRFVNNIHDIIDDRIDVVSRGVMGLTVSCARCHDHKYDPIPTKDYYSLYGVFSSSTEPDEQPLLGKVQNSKAHDEYLAEQKKRVEERTKFRQTKESEVAARVRQQAGEYLITVVDTRGLTNKTETDELVQKRKLDAGIFQRWVQSLEAWSKTNHPVFAPWASLAALSDDEFPAKSKELIAGFNKSGEGLNPLLRETLATNPPASMKSLAETYGKLFAEVDQRWQSALTNSPQPTALPDTAAEALRQILYAQDAPSHIAANEYDRLFDVPASQKLRELQRKIDELDGTHPGAPPRAMALVDKPKPQNVNVFVRGNAGNRGPEAPRQFLEVLSPGKRQPFEKGSGRLELAEAIADPRNPLTARVLVNRVWLHHFGAGLVRTPSDFGLRSEPPTHPDLLDYLATRFVQEGWSVKKLHRLIMLSSVYQQSSEENPGAARVDPNNHALWRMNRRRLDFESMRDTLLAVSGKLDPTAGGHAVDITTEPFATRRTVYGYIDRQNLPGLFRTFDFASPDTSNPQRFFTTVPQQSLYLMNSPFVVQQAKSLVDREEFKALSSEADRIGYLYRQAFQREPSSAEIRLASEFRRTQPAPEPQSVVTHEGWQYGYGEVDEAAGRVKHFERLPHFTGSEFQGGPAMPDPKLGWVMLNDAGGHTGNTPQHAAIRRWIAPRNGEVKINGTLRHDSNKGDGVRGRIVSSREGLLGNWTVQDRKEETKVARFKVERGDTVDFVADCGGSVDYDSFGWEARITFADTPEGSGKAREKGWDTKKDFAGASKMQQKPLTDWEKYAHVLLLSNELVFVD